jgi:DNA/RNA endonuclease YhcR with UshA esterase domain
MSELKVGDQIQWMSSRRVGRGYSFSTKKGKIVSIDGRVITAKASNGRQSTMDIDDVRTLNQHSPVKDVFDGFTKAASSSGS